MSKIRKSIVPGKSFNELQNYTKIIKNEPSSNDTIDHFTTRIGSGLEGSADSQKLYLNYITQDSKNILKPPLHLRFSDWFKQNAADFIIGGVVLVIAFGVILPLVINNNRDVGILYEKVDTVKDTINDSEKNLSKAIDDTRNQIQMGQAIKDKDIENRINLIEQKTMDSLENIKKQLSEIKKVP